MEQRLQPDLTWRTERAAQAAALSTDDIFVLGSLRLKVPSADLELRVPQTFEEILDVARLAASGVVAPGDRFFGVDWERGEPDAVARGGFANVLQELAPTPSDWRLPLLAYQHGELVGRQSLRAQDFAVTREVDSGSWVRPDRHGQGIGFGMRVAVLRLSFDVLGALSARSVSFAGNVASERVSQKCGYRLDGTHVVAQGSQRLVGHRWLLRRDQWGASSSALALPRVEISGVTPQLLSALGAVEASE